MTEEHPGRIRRISKWLALAAAVLLLIFGGLFAFIYYPRHPLPQPEPVDEIVYLDQGWGAESRQNYYYTAQGTNVKDLRYSWFINLEQPRSRKLFADPAYLRDFGFLVDTAPTAKNPAQLPVGFAHHYDSELQDELLDITCATCHTGEFNIKRNGKTVGVRIDGGEARHAFTDMSLGNFLPELILSLTITWADPFTFDRFAHRVLGPDHFKEGKSKLHGDLFGVLVQFLQKGYTDLSKHLYPVQEGFGRTDAIGRIANTVFADHIPKAGNYRVGDAPVSYPPVWDIWKFDWVQYGASVRHPLARNVGEGMGVGAKFSFFDRYGRPIPPGQRYRASTLIDNLTVIEATLQTLTPPRWPEELLGTIDCAKATTGKKLFELRCLGCHGPREASDRVKRWQAPGKLMRDARMKRNDAAFGLDHLGNPPFAHWLLRTLPVDVIGTDPRAARNFVNNRVDLSSTGLTNEELRNLMKPLFREDLARRQAALASLAAGGDAAKQVWAQDDAKIASELNSIDVHSVSTGAGLNFIGLLIRKQYREDARYRAAEAGDELANTDGADDDLFFGEIDLPQTPLAYKARPLAGAWATAPYLHNGSVPTLYQLLLPVEKRDKNFFVGRKEYDLVHLGYKLDPLSKNGFWFDTSIAGNANTGHEFSARFTGSPGKGVIGPELTDDERYAIIEYLKVRQDSSGVIEFPAHCSTGVPAAPAL